MSLPKTEDRLTFGADPMVGYGAGNARRTFGVNASQRQVRSGGTLFAAAGASTTSASNESHRHGDSPEDATRKMRLPTPTWGWIASAVPREHALRNGSLAGVRVGVCKRRATRVKLSCAGKLVPQPALSPRGDGRVRTTAVPFHSSSALRVRRNTCRKAESGTTYHSTGREDRCKRAAEAHSSRDAPASSRSHCFFGGSTYRQSWPDAVVQLVSLPVLLLSLSRTSEWASYSRLRSAMVIIGIGFWYCH